MSDTTTDRFQSLFQNSVPKEVQNRLIFSYQMARSTFFTAQQRALPLFELLFTGRNRIRNKEFLDKAHISYDELVFLLKKDSENISHGVYPISVLKTESAYRTLSRFPKIVWDGIKISNRRHQKKNQEFSPKARRDLADYPEYFQRNFHFQTDGYLSAESAELYEHQVEILFSGTADAMRRLILPPMKKYLNSRPDLKKIRILELGAGTGSLSRFVKLTFPELELTVTDISESYLRKVQNHLKGCKKVNFLRADAADQPFSNESFDLVFSCFLFHELPMGVRQKVLRESLRVLKPGGWCGMVDSLQLGDKPHLDFGLESFPKDFHEPFYKNYTMHPMEKMWSDASFEKLELDFGFFSKMVCGLKTIAS